MVGSLYLLKVAVGELWTLAGGFRTFFLAPWGISRTNLKKYGQWAGEPVSFPCFHDGMSFLRFRSPMLVVTGASEGIGRGYALEVS